MEVASRRVKVQVGSRQETSNSAESAPSQVDRTSALSGIAINSAPLAELCITKSRKRKAPGSQDIDDSQYLVTAMPKKASKAPSKQLFQPSSSSSANQPKDIGPRVEVVDGKIVLRESSLTVDPGDQQGQEFEYEEVEEGAHATSRYSSYTQRRVGRIWGIEETRLFYQALRQCGTDFSMMQTFFPHRTRRELKLKFRREEAAHPQLVSTALKTQLPLELVPFEVALGVDLTNPESPGASTPQLVDTAATQ